MPFRTEVQTEVDNKTFTIYIDQTNSVSIDRQGAQSYLSGQARNNPVAIAAVAQDLVQMLWDEQTGGRTLLTDLPLDDPDRTNDPAQPNLFHARVDPEAQIGQGASAVDVYRPVALIGGTATHRISRSDLIEIAYETIQNPGQTEFQEYVLRVFSPPPVLR